MARSHIYVETVPDYMIAWFSESKSSTYLVQGDISRTVYELVDKILQNYVSLLHAKLRSDQVTLSHMSRQFSCCEIWESVTRLDYYEQNYSRNNFTRFQLRAHKSFVKQFLVRPTLDISRFSISIIFTMERWRSPTRANYGSGMILYMILKSGLWFISAITIQ